MWQEHMRFGQIMIGVGDTKITDPPPGTPAWSGAQPFFGFSIGVQPIKTLVDYPPNPNPDK